MIPKRIITTWICAPPHPTERGELGYRAEHHELFYKCLASWHRLMPDYDIRIISLGNIFDYGSDPWAEMLLRAKSRNTHIGLSQWARVHWLDKLGGIYVDMDVEAVQRFDKLLNHLYFVGHEGGDAIANNAIMGSVPNHPFLKRQMDYMHALKTPAQIEDKQFGNETGPRMVTKLLREHYRWDAADKLALLDDAITVYPSPVFYPYFWTAREKFTPACITPDTVAIHHWASSWVRWRDWK